jgi:hypothetical protein
VTWTLELTYRPLQGMDPLRTLLLASCAAEPCELSLLAQVFCLPPVSLAAELKRLQVYGLAGQLPEQRWAATPRGRRVVAVWEALGRKATKAFAVTPAAWPLGVGEFSVPFEVAAGEAVGRVVELDLHLDERSARAILAGSTSERPGEQAPRYDLRRRLAAEGVLVYGWLRALGGAVAAAAAEEPAAFLCRVGERRGGADGPLQNEGD